MLINYKSLKAFEGAADFSINEDNETVSNTECREYYGVANVCCRIYLNLKHFEGLFLC